MLSDFIYYYELYVLGFLSSMLFGLTAIRLSGKLPENIALDDLRRLIGICILWPIVLIALFIHCSMLAIDNLIGNFSFIKFILKERSIWRRK